MGTRKSTHKFKRLRSGPDLGHVRVYAVGAYLDGNLSRVLVGGGSDVQDLLQGARLECSDSFKGSGVGKLQVDRRIDWLGPVQFDKDVSAILEHPAFVGEGGTRHSIFTL
jgi:hypothetical protein